MKIPVYGLEGLINELIALKQRCFDQAFDWESLNDQIENNYTKGYAEGQAAALRHIMKELGSYDIYDPEAPKECKHIRIGKEQL